MVVVAVVAVVVRVVMVVVAAVVVSGVVQQCSNGRMNCGLANRVCRP